MKKDLIIRIIGEVALGYIANTMLRYWPNAAYILILNLLLTTIFAKDYTVSYHKENSKIIKWIFIQQIFGFCNVYAFNYLSSISITTSIFVNPTAIALGFILAFFVKEIKRKPKLKDFF